MELVPGQTYSDQEIQPLVAPDDVENVRKWLRGKPSTFRFEKRPLRDFHNTINSLTLHQSQPHGRADKARTKRIVGMIRDGKPAFPIFVDARDGFILEGRHRIVAFHQLGLEEVPTIIVQVATP